MSDIPVDKKFAILCQITRAQHFSWHRAVRELCPDADMPAITNKMWELTGAETGAAYLKHLDDSKPLAPQIAASVVWSSQCMGEDATLELSDDGQEGSVVHADCPWLHWHKKQDLLHEDRPGCDQWFASTVDTINKAQGTRLRFETTEALPDGDACCRRRFWVED